MDKLKEQLAVVKEHSFWIMCGGILLVSLVSWYWSTGSLQVQQKKYKGEIDSAQSMLDAIRKTADHPNESTSKGMDVITVAFGEDVYSGWSRLAENQQKVLVWGGIFGTDAEFQKEVRPLWPIETAVPDGKEPITVDSRRLYREYILNELPKLADIIRSKWMIDARTVGSAPSMGGMGGGAGMPGMPGMAGMAGGGLDGGVPGGAGMPGMAGGAGMAGMPGMPGMAGGGAMMKDIDPSIVVIWNESNQKEITQVHFGLATSEEQPKSLQVLYAQEDLWVFENLMKIIKDTNGDAARRHEAAIKYIEYVRIGKTAGDVAGQITGMANASGGMGGMPGGGVEGGAGMMMQGMMPGAGGAGGAGGPGMAPPGGGAGAAAAPSPGGAGAGGMGMPGMPGGAAGSSTALGSGRYVDKDYASITDINRLRNAMRGTPTKPEDMLLAVAKRMPVRMQFTMDQRKVPVLLANCGNSSLPLEVRQIRVNRPSTASAAGGAGGGGGGMGMPGMAGAGAGADGDAGGPPGMAGGMPGMAGGMPGMAGGMPGMAGGMPGMAGGMGGNARPASSISSSKEDPNEITIEIYGIVYIYNPPDRKLLGIPDATSPTVPAAPVAPATTPASSPAAPAVPPVTAGAAAGR